MLTLLKIAVTGPVACGKSTVCRIFQKRGAFVVDADAIVHQLLSSDTAISRQVVGLLGSSILSGNRIDRKKVANIVFSDSKKLEQLEKILHPAVFLELQKSYAEAKKNASHAFFVAEVPLLYEAKMDPFFDFVIAVTAGEPLCKSRSRLTAKEYEARMARQHLPASKASKADAVINNTQDLAALESQVDKIIHQLKEPKRK